jgi:2-polyprenyl-3-methyl-5-hydroxy-6-metoxy-1,4-benzoquinol methylase
MNKTDTFSPSFFKNLKEAEENYFWFHVRRKWIYDNIRRFIPPPAKLLEIGCGTGNVSSYLAGKGYTVTGCDLFEEVGLFDVIEHLDDDIAPLKEASRVLREGGIVVITVPAGENLWSRIDEASYHKRRYTRERLKLILSGVSLEVRKIDYMFMSLYLPMYLIRKHKKDMAGNLKIKKVTNILMKAAFDAERMLSKFVPLPFGTSLMAVAQKGLPRAPRG